MKKTFTITFMTLATVSVVALLMMRNNQIELNDDFSIETVYGDERIINEILEVSAIRSTGRGFQRVVLTSGTPEITDTNFDPLRHIDERQLEHRAFYRGTHRWQRENPLTTQNFHIMITDNWPNATTINVLDLRTGAVVRAEDTTNRHAFGSSHWWGAPQRFIEHDGDLYIVVTADNEPRARFYTINWSSASIIYRFSIEDTSENPGTWLQTANNLYFYENGAWIEHHANSGWWSEHIEVPSETTGGFDPETGIDTLTASGRRLTRLNLDTKTFEERPSPVGVSEENPWNSVFLGDYFITEQILSCDNPADEWNPAGWCGFWDGISLINLETGHRHAFLNDLFDELNENNWGGSHGTRFSVIGDYLIENSTINETLQVLRVFDLNTMELVYRGHIQLETGRGLLTNNWNAMPEPFQIRARD